MRKFTRVLTMAVVASFPLVTMAADTINDQEEHVLRGFFDRQSTAAAYDRLAAEKGSTELVKKFAQSELDMYKTLAEKLKAMDTKFKLVTQPMNSSDRSPKLSQGVSRGVDKPPAGGAWAADNAAGFLNMGAGAGGPPAAGAGPAPGGAPGAAPGGTPPAGGAPGAAPGGAGGGMSRGGNDLAELQKLSGTEFDKQYLLRVLLAHNAIMGHIVDELTMADGNPDMKAFASEAMAIVQKQSSAAQRLIENPGATSLGGPGGAPGGAAPGGAPPAKK